MLFNKIKTSLKMKPYSIIISVFIISIISITSCKQTEKEEKSKTLSFFKANTEFVTTSGRVDTTQTGDIVLISSASSIKFNVLGDSCTVLLRNHNQVPHSFVSIEVDNKYMGRIKVQENEFRSYNIQLKKGRKNQIVTIYKATEAQTGNINFGGINAQELLPIPSKKRKKIEFIGNSITCGMGVDYKEIPCGTGLWFDQHNAYFAYGPRIGRALDVDYMLSASSGIGMYRNWDVDGPVMPDVYENRYLNTDSTKTWDFKKFTPDLVSICLGTNDLSDGDDVHPRLPFNTDKFTKKYIKFIDKVYSHYPNVQIALLSSPMLEGEKSKLLNSCLQNVKKYFDDEEVQKSIAIYFFDKRYPNGCSTHPDMNDHQLMAESLIPFYKNLL